MADTGSIHAVLPQPSIPAVERARQFSGAGAELASVPADARQHLVPAQSNRLRNRETATRSGRLIPLLVVAILLAASGGVAIGWALKDRFTYSSTVEGQRGMAGLVATEQIRDGRQAEREGASVVLDALSLLDQFFAASDEAGLRALLVRHDDDYPLVKSLVALHKNQAITGEASDLMIFHTGWAQIGGEIVEEIRFGGPLATKGGTRIVKVYLYKIGKSWKVDGYVYEQSMTNRLGIFLESPEIEQPHVITVVLSRKPDEYDRIEVRPPGGQDVLFAFAARPDTPGFKEFRKIGATGKALKNLQVKRTKDGAIELTDNPIVGEIAYWPGGAG